jgi:hypothetical protein
MVRWQIAAILLFVVALASSPVLAEENTSFGQRLILNVYLDDSGKALVTGYADNISGLLFLNSSQYRYENETSQLYALTDGLTAKVGDLWTIRFDATGSYDDYHVSFYLPSDMRLGNINTSSGLGYLLSASNESLVADVQGYEVHSPRITIDYQQSLQANGSSIPILPPPGNFGKIVNLSLALAAFALIVAVLAVVIFMRRRKEDSRDRRVGITNGVTDDRDAKIAPVAIISSPSMAQSARSAPSDSAAGYANGFQDGLKYRIKDATLLPDDPTDDGVYSAVASESPPVLQPPRENAAEPLPSVADIFPDQPSRSSIPASHDAKESAGDERIVEENGADEGDVSLAKEADQSDALAPEKLGESRASHEVIVISSEMEAVMQTLTARERAVMTTLIDHGGRMTQADIRYDTGTPKSSLTGILISLERRKLVTKKEWGRTNIIELSEWFLSKKERS